MKTYFKGEFSTRRPITVAVAVALTLGGLGLGMIWLPQVINGVGLKDATSAFLAALFSLVFLAGGVFLLFQIIKNKKTLLLITSDGLCYGEQRYRWEDITEIGVMSKYARRNDLYCATRLHPFAVELPISTGLGAEEVQALFGDLRREVLKLHPHIQLSGGTDDDHIC